MDTNNSKATKASRPVEVFNRDALSVSIFRNEALREGEPSAFYKATISKTYKKKDEGFGRTSSFEVKDFPKICSLLIQAGEFIESLEANAGEQKVK